MKHAVDDLLKRAFPAAPWLFQPAETDVVTMLTDALGADWSVMRETNCEGEISIIALSAVEADWVPSIVLYEKDGKAMVATVRDDEWYDEQSFHTFPQAISTFIAVARNAQISPWSDRIYRAMSVAASSNRHSQR